MATLSATPTITTLAQYWDIPDAAKGQPHHIRLTLTALYYDPHWNLLWVTDGDRSTYFPTTGASPDLNPLQRFIVEADVIPTRGLQLATAKLTVLPETSKITPLDIRGNFADAKRFDCHLVNVEGYVNEQFETDPNHLTLSLAVEGYPCTAQILLREDSPIPQIAGAVVRLTGVYTAAPGTVIHPNIWVSSPDNLQVVGWLDHDKRFDQPIVPVEQLATSNRLVRVAGTVTSVRRGESLLLRDPTGEVKVLTAMTKAIAVGSQIEAIGYPQIAGFTPTLVTGLYRPGAASLAPSEEIRGLPLLRLVAQVRALDPAAAEQGYPVRLRGAVMWSNPPSRQFYLMGTSGGVAATLPAELGEMPKLGYRVDITGRTKAGGFAPTIEADSLLQREMMILPAGRAISLDHALTGIEDSQWVSLSGFVRSADHRAPWHRLTVGTPSGDFVAVIPDSVSVDSLVGAVVQFSGVCRALADNQRQLTGVELLVPGLDYTQIQEPRPNDPYLAPRRTIGGLRQFSLLNTFDHRICVSGIVVHQDPGERLNLQDGTQTIFVIARDPTPVPPGTRVEAVGFPGRQSLRLVLREAVWRPAGRTREPAPTRIEAPSALLSEFDGRLVRLDAKLVGRSRRPQELQLVCQSGDAVFDALIQGPDLAALDRVAIGSVVTLTGVYEIDFKQDGRPGDFALKLRSPKDIVVLSRPSWWTGPRALTVVGVLFAVVLAGFAWVVSLRRRVERQTTEIRHQIEKSARLEAELVRSSKLESLGVLAGGIAHDFNNLLTVILGNLSLVQLGESQLRAEDQNCLHESERAALRARDLTMQLLTFAKGGDPVRSAVSLPDVIREAAGFALHGSAVLCEFNIASDLWPAHVDRGQISQVVHNIVINAMQAMPDGGIVRIGLRNEQVAAEQSLPIPVGPYLRLSIADTGAGITAENLPRIFDPYFTTKKTGSGLGLATVYSIIKKHGGHIAVNSEAGRGATFDLWLPAATEVDAAEQPSINALPSLSGRALLMDDEDSVRRLGSAMLRRLHMEAVTAGDGREAIELFKRAKEAGHPFDIVILDLTVPGSLGGKDAATALRAIDPQVRLVVSSGYSNDPVMANYRDYGFDGCIPKPYILEHFARSVAEMLDAPGQS